ncbi:hypothetical protein EJB05_06608, partial [Eragrostis curvula]
MPVVAWRDFSRDPEGKRAGCMRPSDKHRGHMYPWGINIGDKNSQNALKWAIDSLVQKGQTLVLVHVNTKGASGGVEDGAGFKLPTEPHLKDLIFLPFRCFCTRKDIQCKDVVPDEHDVAKAITEFSANAAIEKLVIGATSRGGFRFKADIPTTISKGAPDFCTVYVINKGKVSSTRNAIRAAPRVSPLRSLIQQQQGSRARCPWRRQGPGPSRRRSGGRRRPGAQTPCGQQLPVAVRARGHGPDAQVVRRPEPPVDAGLGGHLVRERGAPERPPRMSSGSTADSYDHSFEMRTPSKWGGDSFGGGMDPTCNFSQSSSSSFCSLGMQDDVEAEMKRLRLELKQTMDMYSTACKEALTAKQKATELQRWKMEEEAKSQDSKLTEESANMAMIEREKAKAKAAEAAEKKLLKEAEERKNNSRGGSGMSHEVRYRKYTIEEIEHATENKIGEGGYGPVYKGFLDHTQVAIKVLRPDAAQGRSQFQQEVEVLSTFCYIDPEYQQTGMLGVKSDVSSRPSLPWGSPTTSDMLDPAVPDWPVEEAQCLAELAIRCCELRRPDLGNVVLPELNRLRALGEDNMQYCGFDWFCLAFWGSWNSVLDTEMVNPGKVFRRI